MAQEEEFPAWELPGQAAAASHVVRPLACARLLPAGSPRQCPECQAYWHSSLRHVHRTLVSEEQVAKRDAAAAGPSSDFPISKLPREVLEERLRNTSKELQVCKAKLKYRADALKLSKADTAELRNTVLKADAALKGEAGSECDLQGAKLLIESGNGAMYKPGSAFRNYWDAGEQHRHAFPPDDDSLRRLSVHYEPKGVHVPAHSGRCDHGPAPRPS
jgi:hypothetical protein